MSLAVEPEVQKKPASRVALWVGRGLSAFVILFLLLDGVAKVTKVAPVLEACGRLGVPEWVIPGLGFVLIAATLVYAFPKTAILGAIVLTGYLGGAIWTHLRMNEPVFPIVFPLIVASMIWGGLYLREPRLRALVPLRS